MISAVIPTLNSAASIGQCLDGLMAPGENMISEIIVSDGGSSDETVEIAERFGAKVLKGTAGRGRQLAAGSRAAKGPWLLFLHSDTCLSTGWSGEVRKFMECRSIDTQIDVEGSGEPERIDRRAAVWTLQFDDTARASKILASLVAIRTRLLGLPYGDQGLLINKKFYDALGGYSEIPLMEDVELVRKIGRARLTIFETPAITSAERYRRDGYILRPVRNVFCLILYFIGVSPEFIRKIYG